MDLIIEELISFIKKEINDYKINITPDTLLENDLGISGDEASELIHSFAINFNVDIEDFIFSNYFYEEPNAFKSFSEIKKPLTVNHLRKAIQYGRLNEFVINL